MIEVECAQCRRRFAAPDNYAGKTGRCKGCGAPLKIVPRQRAAPDAAANQGPQSWDAGQPIPQPARRPQPKLGGLQEFDFRALLENRNSRVWLAAGGAGTLLLVILIFWSLKGGGSSAGERPAPAGAASSPATSPWLPPVPVPSTGAPIAAPPAPVALPERRFVKRLTAGVDLYDARLPIQAPLPGHQNRLKIYLPPGAHAAHSLPCVLQTSAGTMGIVGTDVGDDAEDPERVPYVQAGFAVVAYEMDGPLANQNATPQQVLEAYTRFKAADGGLVNARNAIAYALQKLPEVDPARIYSAGHSSAGTTSLYLAAMDDRIKACVAYAPVTNLVKRFSNTPQIFQLLPDSRGFMDRISPEKQAASFRCPIFLFHALDDSVVPLLEVMSFSTKLRSLGKNVVLSTVPTGDHYDSMIRQGIPQGIDFLRRLAPAAGTAQP